MAIVAQDFDYVVGVDTHAAQHVLCVLAAGTGARVRHGKFPTTGAGLARAQGWIEHHAPGRRLVAMEGTGGYGARFCQRLQAAGLWVAEVEAPVRKDRRHGKSDLIDAELAARGVLGVETRLLATPRSGDPVRVALKVLLAARRRRQRARTRAVNQLTALTRIHDLGVEVRGVLTRRQISQIAGWRRRRADDAGRAAARAEAVALAREITDLAAQLRANQAAITEQVTGWTPWLIDAEHRGIGPVTGAQILIAYSHPGRVRTEAAFAKMAGTAPLPTGSGNSTGHRLSNRGDRDLNSAFWRIAHYRYHHDPNTAGFAHERRARGKSERAIVRKLKRYLTRSIWRELTHNLTPQHSPEPVTGQAAA